MFKLYSLIAVLINCTSRLKNVRILVRREIHDKEKFILVLQERHHTIEMNLKLQNPIVHNTWICISHGIDALPCNICSKEWVSSVPTPLSSPDLSLKPTNDHPRVHLNNTLTCKDFSRYTHSPSRYTGRTRSGIQAVIISYPLSFRLTRNVSIEGQW